MRKTLRGPARPKFPFQPIPGEQPIRPIARQWAQSFRSLFRRLNVTGPWAFRVAAVVRMMKYITKVESNMPVMTSLVADFNSPSVQPPRRASVTFSPVAVLFHYLS
jgi:enamine deaminase RidA (YjgF/YER057c/UK114 family)